MSSYQKLFVNSTNRFSAVKNIIISQPTSNKIINHNQSSLEHHLLSSFHQHNNCTTCNNSTQQITQTFEQLQSRHDQLVKNINQANQQKQMMKMLFDKIFKIQKGESDQLKKRFRRKKSQIQNKFICNLSNCDKIYSSSTSLSRHIKLKHTNQPFEPPQPNYEIPPPPNLTDSNELEKKSQSNLKTLSESQKDLDDQSSPNPYSMVESEDQESSQNC